MLNKKKNNKGFTLVELLVVIAIIGILAVVAVPALFKNIEKGKVADLEADISAIRSASLSVYSDTSSLPIDTSITSGSVIGSELEGLSKPFGAVYTTELDTTNNILLLKIVVAKDISLNGAKKLDSDLGDKYVDASGAPIETPTAVTNNTPIYIKLMSK